MVVAKAMQKSRIMVLYKELLRICQGSQLNLRSQKIILYARKDDKRIKITNESVNKYIHLMRAKHDGILIGNGTYKKDNPQLTVRLDGYNKRLHKFLLSSNGEIQTESNLFIDRQNNDLTIITSDETRQSTLKGLEANELES